MNMCRQSSLPANPDIHIAVDVSGQQGVKWQHMSPSNGEGDIDGTSNVALHLLVSSLSQPTCLSIDEEQQSKDLGMMSP